MSPSTRNTPNLGDAGSTLAGNRVAPSMCINCGETPGFHRTTDAIQLCFDQILDINDPECIQNIAPLLLEYHQLANVPIGSLLIVMADSPLELVRIKAYKLVKNYSCIQIGLLFQRYLQLVVDDSTVCRLRASMLATYLCDKFDAGSCSWDLQTEGLLDSGEKLVFKPSVQSVGSSSANFAGWIKLLLEEIRGKLETCKVMSVVIDGSLHGYVESLMSILFYHPDQLSRINETLTNAILQIMNDITQSGLSYFSGLLNDEQDVRKNVAITTWWRSIKCIANSVTVVSRFWDDDQLRQGFDMLSSIICLDHWGVVKHATDPFVEYCKVYTKRSDLFDSLLVSAI